MLLNHLIVAGVKLIKYSGLAWNFNIIFYLDMPTAHLLTSFFFLIGLPNFPWMVSPINYAPIHVLFEEVVVRAGHKVMVEVDK